MNKKVMLILAVIALIAGGLIYGFNYKSDCPLLGTAECPLYQNCPKKGKPDCPIVQNCPKKGTADCPYTKGKANCCSKGNTD